MTGFRGQWAAYVPRSDEVREVLHDFQGQALLRPGELALVGRIEGQPKSVLHVCQQLQAEETGKEGEGSEVINANLNPAALRLKRRRLTLPTMCGLSG